MYDLSAEWKLEARRREREAQAGVAAHATTEPRRGNDDDRGHERLRRSSMDASFSMNLPNGVAIGLLASLIGRFD